MPSRICDEEHIQLNAKTPIFFRKLDQLRHLDSIFYARPWSLNFEAVDALTLDGNMFQATVASSHSVKASLLYVLDVLPASCTPRLFFVVPTIKQFNDWRYSEELPDPKVVTDADHVLLGVVS